MLAIGPLRDAVGQAPTLSVRVTPTNTALLSWTALSTNQGYRVEFRESVSSGVWLPCPWQDQWPQAGTFWNDPRPLANTRFYRVMALTTPRGNLVTSNLTASYTVSQLNALFASYGIPTLIQAQYPVDVFFTLYDTITADGGPTQASGMVMLPHNPGKAVPLLSHQHGTVVLTNEVPSQSYGEYTVGLVWASIGYAAAMPDYLGMGSGSSLHPYVHARSEATAAIDVLRAARTLCAQRSLALNGQVFLIGYSQGGQATMAAHKEIETWHTNEFTLTASAPMAGPHDMSGTMANLLTTNQPYTSPYYLPYVLFAYNSVYRLYDSVTQALVEPYATRLPPLFDGRHSDAQINAEMPSVPSQILKPEFLLAFQTDPQHPFRAALQRNDLYNWRPVARMRLYHCAGDRTVPQINSIIATNAFHHNGATQVLLQDPCPTCDHGSGASYCFFYAKLWFDTLKQ